MKYNLFNNPATIMAIGIGIFYVAGSGVLFSCSGCTAPTSWDILNPSAQSAYLTCQAGNAICATQTAIYNTVLTLSGLGLFLYGVWKLVR